MEKASMVLRVVVCIAVVWIGACSKQTGPGSANEELFRKLSAVAESGSAPAQYNLGMLYNNGIGTAADPKRAFQWFEKSAAAGDPLASYKVGCYYSGQFSGVVPIDHDKALAAKLVAANAGYFRAQYDVGVAYASMKNFQEAMKWWNAAAEQGDLGALGNLSQVYRTGLGTAKNSQKALELLLIAGRLVSEDQIAALRAEIDTLKKEVSTDGIAQAEKAAASWVSRPSELSHRAILGIQEAQKFVQ